MSLISFFLQKEDQTPSNIKYLHSLLALPVPKIVREKEIVKSKIEKLEGEIRAQASTESKDFVNALSNTENLIQLADFLENDLKLCENSLSDVKSGLNQSCAAIESVLKEQQKIEHISSMQGVVGEILEIPSLLKSLFNSRHYKDVLLLMKFIEKIESDGEVMMEIKEAGKSIGKKMEAEVFELVSECKDIGKTAEMMKILSELKGLGEKQQVAVFLQAKKQCFYRLITKVAVPKGNILTVLNDVQEFFTHTLSVFQGLYAEYEEEVVFFAVEIIDKVYFLLITSLPATISELFEVADQLYKMNTELFIPIGCNIWPETYAVIVKNVAEKLDLYVKKTLASFENLVKLEGWQSLGAKENPILEFGSLSVLYFNITAIINEIR
jgi:hypothetical protein